MTTRTTVSFGPGERVRLWFSYQRYALLMVAAIAISGYAMARFGPRAWYLWVPGLLIAARVLAFACQVYSRFPRKMRATALATRRIRDGRFHPRSVRGYCGDPCFRVVAREILRRAHIPASERRTLIREFRAQAQEPAVIVRFDIHSDTPVQVYGSLISQTSTPEPTIDTETQ